MIKKIGYIGLGKMGKGMVRNLLEKKWVVVVSNKSEQSINELTKEGAIPAYTLKELVDNLQTPRVVWLMVPHQTVDSVLGELTPLLDRGDTIIDGGNSPYKNSMQRAQELNNQGIHFLDAGTSGGPSGARNGACVMIGGEKSIFDNNEELFKDISVENGYAYMGKAGAGHFVKMVHNGIEYGMMQAIGEGFEVLKKSPFNLNLEQVADLYGHQSVITSSLINWAKNAFKEYGQELTEISGSVSHSGEGLWTVEAAKEFGVPVPIIEGSLKFREESQANPSFTGQVVSALRNQFGGHEVLKKNEQK